MSTSFYDYADDILKMWEYVEKEEGRKLSEDERLLIACMVVNSDIKKEAI
ncbi:MAG: hypothetical protein IKY67_13815 [Paludibacteraceae bacterium]|nr:hypothetical protein [Paludibacteraceae bacterium]